MYLEMRNVPMKRRTLMRKALGTKWHPTDWRPSIVTVPLPSALSTPNSQGYLCGFTGSTKAVKSVPLRVPCRLIRVSHWILQWKLK